MLENLNSNDPIEEICQRFTSLDLNNEESRKVLCVDLAKILCSGPKTYLADWSNVTKIDPVILTETIKASWERWGEYDPYNQPTIIGFIDRLPSENNLTKIIIAGALIDVDTKSALKIILKVLISNKAVSSKKERSININSKISKMLRDTILQTGNFEKLITNDENVNDNKVIINYIVHAVVEHDKTEPSLQFHVFKWCLNNKLLFYVETDLLSRFTDSILNLPFKIACELIPLRNKYPEVFQNLFVEKSDFFAAIDQVEAEHVATVSDPIVVEPIIEEVPLTFDKVIESINSNVEKINSIYQKKSEEINKLEQAVNLQNEEIVKLKKKIDKKRDENDRLLNDKNEMAKDKEILNQQLKTKSNQIKELNDEVLAKEGRVNELLNEVAMLNSKHSEEISTLMNRIKTQADSELRDFKLNISRELITDLRNRKGLKSMQDTLDNIEDLKDNYEISLSIIDRIAIKLLNFGINPLEE